MYVALDPMNLEFVFWSDDLCRVLGYPYTYMDPPPHLTTKVQHPSKERKKEAFGSLLEDLSYYLSTLAQSEH